MNRSLIRSYFMMIKSGKCTIDDIPEKYREDVEKFSEEVSLTNAVPREVKNSNLPKAFPALDAIITKIKRVKLRKFTIPILSMFAIPNDIENIKVGISRVENEHNGYKSVSVTLDKELEVSGEPNEEFQGLNVLRIDLEITSDNYETGYITTYIQIED